MLSVLSRVVRDICFVCDVLEDCYIHEGLYGLCAYGPWHDLFVYNVHHLCDWYVVFMSVTCAIFIIMLLIEVLVPKNLIC